MEFDGYPVYLSGCGKVNATIAATIRECIETMELAGTVSEQSVSKTGFVDRDMDAKRFRRREDGVLKNVV